MRTYQQETDDTLVRLYENGNDEAFDELLSRYQLKIFNYLLYLVHDEEIANDLFQETFTKAIMRIRTHRYTESGKFGQWLICIAHNLFIDLYRKGSHGFTVGGDEAAKIWTTLDLRDTNIEDELHNEQTYTDLLAMIKSLPEPQQEIIRLRFYENKSFREIAELTHCSINTALGRARYAVLNLRKMAAHCDLTLSL
ncbi:MAG: sigma-70 family RNA polymerase sigma factor [Bacteroidaceae bacterium]|jgi:RNA polymerase sigma-70 factor (ECF subfamily)|nr:sigma-70 family RNA polymerase sigma factor [Bacteroidaceae bacterium]MBR4243492.1 sigma-70 family RNA polymerase sigma factor [Bacteroidaceae bacterium]